MESYKLKKVRTLFSLIILPSTRNVLPLEDHFERLKISIKIRAPCESPYFLLKGGEKKMKIKFSFEVIKNIIKDIIFIVDFVKAIIYLWDMFKDIF